MSDKRAIVNRLENQLETMDGWIETLARFDAEGKQFIVTPRSGILNVLRKARLSVLDLKTKAEAEAAAAEAEATQ